MEELMPTAAPTAPAPSVAPAAPCLKTALTPAEIQQFRDSGYAGPFTLCSPAEMQVIAARIEREVLSTPGPSGLPQQSRHLDQRVIYDLCSHPAIVDRMASVYGPDLVLWRSNMFNKEPGAKEIPWHQDLAYWPLEPVVNISAWVAIDPCTVENSCVQLIPGSHKGVVPHIKSTPGMAFANMADPAAFDTKNLVNMEMQAGQFFLFNEKTLHHSEPNRSSKRRLGLAVRVTLPFVKVDHNALFKGHKVIVLRGRDLGINDVAQPPVA
jgi:hypothetical protein